jgi:AraC family transcriptional regulator of adaptative response / DNA-3-methyladenine glycosylase II
VEALADRLGVGSRHLRRLFIRHLGATPSAVGQTRRLHFAKKLIDETSLTMTEVALASGFGCVRRFNAAIRKVYQRTPTQIRHLARQVPPQPENQYLFRLSFRPPYNWPAMLRFLSARATPGVERVEPELYRRSIELNGSSGYFELSLDADNDALLARIEFPDPRALSFIIERIRAQFDLSADWATIARCLSNDPMLAQRMEREPGLRVPGSWNGFELAVRAILGQAVTVRGATELAGRIARRFGKPFTPARGLEFLFPSAATLAEADFAGIGLTGARSEAIRGLAKAVCERRISFEGIVDVEAFLKQLCEIPGIGNWTAQYVAMRAIGEPDAFPSSDLGLLRGAGTRDPRNLERRAETWRPWRAYAAMYVWSIDHAHSVKGARLLESEETVDQRGTEDRASLAV